MSLYCFAALNQNLLLVSNYYNLNLESSWPCDIPRMCLRKCHQFNDLRNAIFIILSCQNKVGKIPKRIIAVVLGSPPGQGNN